LYPIRTSDDDRERCAGRVFAESGNLGRPALLHGVGRLQGAVRLLHVPNDPGSSARHGAERTAGGEMRVSGRGGEPKAPVFVRGHFTRHRNASRTAVQSSTGVAGKCGRHVTHLASTAAETEATNRVYRVTSDRCILPTKSILFSILIYFIRS